MVPRDYSIPCDGCDPAVPINASKVAQRPINFDWSKPGEWALGSTRNPSPCAEAHPVVA